MQNQTSPMGHRLSAGGGPMSHMVKPFDPYYVAKVLADIWGREQGCKCQIILTPKEPSETTQEPEKEQGA